MPDCKSRDQLGKLTRGSLNDYFYDKFGHGDSQAYQKVCSILVYIIWTDVLIVIIAAFIGKGQLCSQHGSIFLVNLPAANQGQAQWKHHDHQAWTHCTHCTHWY